MRKANQDYSGKIQMKFGNKSKTQMIYKNLEN